MKKLTSISTNVAETKPKTKLMSEMEPYEICIIDDEAYKENGHIVMRTASMFTFQVMSLSVCKAGYHWDKDCPIKVRPFEGDSITFNLK